MGRSLREVHLDKSDEIGITETTDLTYSEGLRSTQDTESFLRDDSLTVTGFGKSPIEESRIQYKSEPRYQMSAREEEDEYSLPTKKRREKKELSFLVRQSTPSLARSIDELLNSRSTDVACRKVCELMARHPDETVRAELKDRVSGLSDVAPSISAQALEVYCRYEVEGIGSHIEYWLREGPVTTKALAGAFARKVALPDSDRLAVVDVLKDYVEEYYQDDRMASMEAVRSLVALTAGGEPSREVLRSLAPAVAGAAFSSMAKLLEGEAPHVQQYWYEEARNLVQERYNVKDWEVYGYCGAALNLMVAADRKQAVLDIRTMLNEAVKIDCEKAKVMFCAVLYETARAEDIEEIKKRHPSVEKYLS